MCMSEKQQTSRLDTWHPNRCASPLSVSAAIYLTQRNSLKNGKSDLLEAGSECGTEMIANKPIGATGRFDLLRRGYHCGFSIFSNLSYSWSWMVK